MAAATPFTSALAQPAAKDRVAPSASARYLSKTLHIRQSVALCVASLNHSMPSNRRYDRLVQLDRYVIHATVRHHEAIFSIAKPIPVDTTVAIKGTVRVRGQWHWQPVMTRCGLKNGRVVAMSIEPRQARSVPVVKQRLRPNGSYVDNGTSIAG